MKLPLYFFLGFVIDVLGTLDTQAVVDSKPFMSACYSFFITMISILVISQIILSGEFLDLALAYALGSAIGSALTIIYRKRKRG